MNHKVKGDFILETKIDGKELVFVRFKVDDKKWEKHYFDYFLGWIIKEEINYVW